MSELSEGQPIEGRDWSKSPVPHRQCTGHKKNGERCKNAAILGGTVCKFHGGAAKHVRNAARVRLANAADRMARELLNMATADNVSDSVKLAAIRDALDRGGISVKAEIEVTAKPYESIFERLSGGSREAHRNGLGTEDETTPALVVAQHQPIDAQIVDDLNDDDAVDLGDYARPITPDDYESGSAFDSERFGPVSAPPTDGLMSLEEANAEIRRLQTEAARAMREQRALPPGRSAG